MSTTDADSTAFFPGFKAFRITVDDVELYYAIGGVGPPLLLVHGAPQSHIMWRRVAPELAQHYTLVLPDLRGYGRSEKPAKAEYSKRRMGQDLVAIMTALGFDRFNIAGHDRGARVMRRLVKDHPQRVIKAAILDIVPTAHIYANMSKQVAINLWNWCVWPAPEPIPETIIDPASVITVFTRSINTEDSAEKDYLGTNGNPQALHAMCEDYRAGASIDLLHDAADAGTLIETPLLIVWGTRSFSTGSIFDVPAAWANEARNPAFRSVDSGHFIPEEKPAQTVALLLGFFGDGMAHR
jgi:haloacetate dehalogenase